MQGFGERSQVRVLINKIYKFNLTIFFFLNYIFHLRFLNNRSFEAKFIIGQLK
jgi:hypothetical protein